MDTSSNSGSENAKVCGEALQAAQKRVRLAFFLTMGASCIVLLIVINLWHSLLVHNELIQDAASSKSDYLEEYSKQVADQSFYLIPSLGIQITCDDIGLLGPVALLVFSLYSFMTLRASRCHLNFATDDRIAADPLIDALLEIETPPKDSFLARCIFRIPRLLQFLPAAVCGTVVAYWLHAHFAYSLQNNPIDKVISASRPMAHLLDYAGAVFGMLVLLANCASFASAKDKEQTAGAQLEQNRRREARRVIRNVASSRP
jgi:predicted nucleic acid-binding Zn ribbon protein